MNATGSLTLIDDYLDALICGDPVPEVAPARPALLEASMPEPATPAVAFPPAAARPPAPPAAFAEPPAAFATHADTPSVRALTAATDTGNVRAIAASPATQRWLRVAVDGASYAVELLRVQEVVRLAPIVAMRGSQRAVLGVMNLRGRIVPVFDLGLWLEAGRVTADERSRIVVVERDDELIGVLVSAVDDVVWLGRDRIEPPLAGTECGPILGIARVGATPTVLLDAGELFE